MENNSNKRKISISPANLQTSDEWTKKGLELYDSGEYIKVIDTASEMGE